MSPLTDEDLDAIEARHKEAACEASYSSGWSASWLSAEDVPDLVAEVQRLKQEVTLADRAMRERHGRFATLHADVSLLGRELGMLGAEEYAPDDRAALFDFMRRLDNEVENLHIAATIGPRVAAVTAAIERAASVARFRSVIDDFLRAPAMYARDPECGTHVVYGAMLAAGGNGRTWYDACLAVGLARGNVAVAAQTWDDVRRLARHLHETAETWAVKS